MTSGPADRGKAHQAPVFIIGGARTGSEMLKTMLSKSIELDFVDELFLHCPRWLHKDLWTNVLETAGDPLGEDAVDRVVELVFSGRPYGWVFSVADQKFDRSTLRDWLAGGDVTPKRLLSALMASHNRLTGKRGFGAKFPMHYGLTDRLLAWYPDCKLIHTTRDPRAVYASQANKYLLADAGKIRNNWIRFKHFIHINIQIAWTAAIHSRYSGLPNYRLVRYEDVVEDPRATIQDLCNFLEVDYLDDMLSPEQYGSSYESKLGGKGISKSSLSAWRKKASSFTTSLIWAIHPRARRRLGYLKP